jgi:hypothetical protein
MWQRHGLTCIATIAGLLAVAALGYMMTRDNRPRRVGPASLQEVMRIADAAGLYHRSDEAEGRVTIRLIVSEYPVTFDRANMLHFGDTTHSCWTGTVAACLPWRDYIVYKDDEYGVIWGEVFLFGDPQLIRKLIAEPVAVD